MKLKSLFIVGWILFVNAGPPPEKASVNLAAGGGGYDYTSGGCGSPQFVNSAAQGSVDARASYRMESGFTGSVDASASLSRTYKSEGIENEDEEGGRVGTYDGIGMVSPKLGLHTGFFGFELGLAFFALGHGATAVPSGTLWIGAPVFFLHSSVLDSTVRTSRPISFSGGVGHSSEKVRFETGFLLGSRGDFNATIDGYLKLQYLLFDQVWFGGIYEFGQKNHHVMASVGLDF